MLNERRTRMRDWEKILLALGFCAVFLAISYLLIHGFNSPAAEGIKGFIQRMTD